MVNKIWIFFICLGITFCLCTGNIETLNNTILNSGKNTLDMILKIFPVMALWLGIMNIAKESGLLNKFSQKIYPLMHKIFPEIPKNHESLGFICSNIIANMFGLGNAATPFGLKAMKSLQEINPKKDEASRSMITFLVINTSGVTIIPTTVISLRMMYESKNPSEIILATIITTIISLMCALLIDYIFAKGNKK